MFKVQQKISLMIVVLIFLLLNGTVSHAEGFNLTAPIVFLMDMETGQVLYEKNADTQWAPASTTKIVTALVALEHANLDTEMKATSHAINTIPWDYGRAGIMNGEILTLHDLLHFVLVISANEAANVIAENISPTGEIKGFVELMNEKSKDLGMHNSHFTNTFGLDDENHYSSARDLAIAAQEAMKNPMFRQIVGLKTVPLPDTNLRKSDDWDKWHIESTNRLLNSNSEYYSRVTGIKTGYTGSAGRCLVFSAINDDGLELLGVILGTENYDTLFSECQELLEYGFQNYSVQTLVSSGEHYGRYDVVDAVDNVSVEIQTLGSVTHLLPNSPEKLQSEVTVQEVLDSPFAAPIERGQVLGYKSWFYNGKEIGNIQLVATNDIEKTLQAQIRDRIQELMDNNTLRNLLIIFGILILFIILLRLILKGISRRKNHYRRNYRL